MIKKLALNHSLKQAPKPAVT
ncbi:hypothetical protein D018_0179A, partial [Vibrio parahaemolyticus VP2007-007]